MSLRSPFALLLIALLTPACSSSDDPAGPDVGTSTLTATVDGVTWSADVVLGVNNGFTLGIEGSAGGIEIAMSVNLVENTLPGTVDLTTGSTGASIQQGGETWYPVGPGGSGSLTVQTLTSDRATGTFQFVATPVGGSATGGARTVTAGSFDVRF